MPRFSICLLSHKLISYLTCHQYVCSLLSAIVSFEPILLFTGRLKEREREFLIQGAGRRLCFDIKQTLPVSSYLPVCDTRPLFKLLIASTISFSSAANWMVKSTTRRWFDHPYIFEDLLSEYNLKSICQDARSLEFNHPIGY